MKMIALLAVACTFVVAGSVTSRAADSLTLKTDHARFTIEGRGFITSIAAINSGKLYSPIGHQSPLLSLHESGQPNDKLVLPSAASFPLFGGRVTLKYPGGATAVIKVAGKGSHLRFQLLSLEPRGTVDNVVWGPVNTTITGKIGDLT